MKMNRHKLESVAEHAIPVMLYMLVCVIVAVYQVLQMKIDGISFDWNSYLFKVGMNCTIIFAIFIIGFPEGKKEAMDTDSFKASAGEFKKKLDEIIKNGRNTQFRKHCEVFNTNSLYDRINSIIEIECGLDMSYFYKPKDELLSLLKAHKIDFKRYCKIRQCQKLKIKHITVNANMILFGSVAQAPTLEYNEKKETLKIGVLKAIQTMIIPIFFSLSLVYELEINISAIMSACVSVMTALMAIIFAKRSGYNIIKKRETMFIRWSDFITDFENKPLDDKDRMSLNNQIGATIVSSKKKDEITIDSYNANNDVTINSDELVHSNQVETNS